MSKHRGQSLHSDGLAHRDIKLENILLVRAGDASGPFEMIHVQLADFGLAFHADLDQDIDSRALTPCGTVSYYAPELLISTVTRQGYCPFGIDAWTLGCVLYACLFGRHPFNTPIPLRESDVAFYAQEHLIQGKFLTRQRLVTDGLLRCEPEDEKVAAHQKKNFVKRVFRGMQLNDEGKIEGPSDRMPCLGMRQGEGGAWIGAIATLVAA